MTKCFLLVLSLTFFGCASTVSGANDGGGMLGADVVQADSVPPTDAIPALDAVGCSCFTGQWNVVSPISSMRIAYTLDVRDCGGVLECRVDNMLRRCLRTMEPTFRVYLDALGGTQLMFTSMTCTDAWSGQYISEGGTAYPISATRTP